MSQKKPLFSLLLISLFSLGLNAQDAGPVIKKYAAFIGGEKKWKKIKTLKTSGKYNYGGIEFPFSAYSKAPNRYKFIVPLEGKYYAQAFDGTKGWKIDGFKNETSPTMLNGKEALLMANESEVELEDVFINFKRKGHKVSLEGNDTIDGKKCNRIKLTRSNANIETYYFDDLTGALVMKMCPSKNVELQGAILKTVYSDYRDVDGIKIPFKSISSSNDQVILEVTINKAEVNIPMDDSIFQPGN